jgi:exopolyphosphatase/guanosine-5'-triphosphate,3'-diphosphate pyrophosphatase
MAVEKTVTRRARIPVLPARSEFRVAAIDVGSNSLHMVIALADPDGAITTLFRMKEMVGLGRISFPSKRLTAEAMDRAIATLARFQQAARRRNCEKILAVATSAVREAENGGDFLTRARDELKLHIKMVSARDEAKLIYFGVRHGMELKAPTFIIDIGGGSVEFIVGDSSRAVMLESRKLGATRMTAKFIRNDPPTDAELKSLLACYDKELTPICEQVAALRPVETIGTSGTMENLAAMCATLFGESKHMPAGNPSAVGVIERDSLEKLVAKLTGSKSQARAEIKGLDDQRKDQIIAGAVLVLELLRRLKIDRITVIKSALREGIMVEYLSRHLPDLRIRRDVPDPRRRSVLDLARRCEWNPVHSEQVARLCIDLFDQLKPLHHLGSRARELIEYATLLHDIGWHIGKSEHHKHSRYLIRHGDLKGFTAEEIEIMGNIARYHRGSLPKEHKGAFGKLGRRAKSFVRAGTALLRLADGLDRSHCSVVSSLSCSIHKKKVVIQIKTRGDAELEIWGGMQKAVMFTDVFGHALEIVEVNR